MAIVKDETKEMSLMDESYEADGDLSALENCVIMPSAQSSGRMKVKAPTGQGVLPAGVLLNAPTDTQLAEVREMGIAKIKANGAFNAGIELAIAATTGKVAAAASGDWVVGISREAASAANHLVSVRLTSPYQLN